MWQVFVQSVGEMKYEYLQGHGEGLVWLIGSGGVLASCCCGSNCSLAHSMNGHISAATPLTLANQLSLLMIVKRRWSGFVRVRCAI